MGPLKEFTSRNGLLTVHKWRSGFEVVHNQSQQSRWIGDGTDMYQGIQYDADKFYAMLQGDLNQNEAEWMEAYFPDLQEHTVELRINGVWAASPADAANTLLRMLFNNIDAKMTLYVAGEVWDVEYPYGKIAEEE